MPEGLSQEEVAADFCDRLEKAGIRYLIGGSVASGIWGDPRSTDDVDIALWVPMDAIDALLSACAEPFYVSEDSVREAMTLQEAYRMFAVSHMDTGFQVDCFLQSATPITEEAYACAEMVEILRG